MFNNVACEAYFSDAGALQLLIDQHALLSVFGRYTERPASYFRELGDAVKLLNLPQPQAEFVRQVRGWAVVVVLAACVRLVVLSQPARQPASRQLHQGNCVASPRGGACGVVPVGVIPSAPCGWGGELVLC